MNLKIVYGLAAVLLASTVSQSFAQEGARPGDLMLTCQQISAERAKLEASQARRVQRAESGRRLLGMAGAAFNAAAPSLLAQAQTGRSGIAANALAGALNSGARSAPAAEPSAPAAPPTETQRLERLAALLTERGC